MTVTLSNSVPGVFILRAFILRIDPSVAPDNPLSDQFDYRRRYDKLARTFPGKARLSLNRVQRQARATKVNTGPAEEKAVIYQTGRRMKSRRAAADRRYAR